MAANINLKIYMPEKLVLDTTVDKVVLPCIGGILTVIDERAPTLMSLEMGEVQVLNHNNEVIHRWMVSAGVADVKENVCTILTEAAYDKKDLSLEKVIEMDKEFPNPFFKWLITYFSEKK